MASCQSALMFLSRVTSLVDDDPPVVETNALASAVSRASRRASFLSLAFVKFSESLHQWANLISGPPNEPRPHLASLARTLAHVFTIVY